MAAKQKEAAPRSEAPAPRPIDRSGAKWSWNDILMIVALICVCWYPVRYYFAGGVVAPSLLNKSLAGRTYIVTGANTGIGYETSLQLAKQGAHVVMAGRSIQRLQSAVSAIKEQVPTADVVPEILDLESFDSVRAFAAGFKEKHDRLNGLVNNAGVMVPPYTVTRHGFELQFQTNHLSHFLLTNLLEDRLIAAAPDARVVVISSRAHEHAKLNLTTAPYWSPDSYNAATAFVAYGNSKMANILHARELARRLGPRGVTAVSLHPGAIRTELMRHIFAAAAPLPEPFLQAVAAPVTHTFLKSPWEGTQTTLHALLEPSLAEAGNNGAYLADCAVKRVTHRDATDQMAADLWELSERLIAQADAQGQQQQQGQGRAQEEAGVVSISAEGDVAQLQAQQAAAEAEAARRAQEEAEAARRAQEEAEAAARRAQEEAEAAARQAAARAAAEQAEREAAAAQEAARRIAAESAAAAQEAAAAQAALDALDAGGA